MIAEPSSIGSRPGDKAAGAYRRGPHWVAVLAAVFTLPLLFVGGSVTTYGVGMAVPDWPTTFGMNMFLYNFWNKPFGVQVEHTHRLYGAAVGLATLFLCWWLHGHESRRWARNVGGAALLIVITQGILGGLRVNLISTKLAAVHGALGQAFFALMVALAVVTSRSWLSDAPQRPDARRIRFLAALTLAIVYGQIALGAWVRHFGGLNVAVVHGGVAAAILSLAIVLLRRVRAEGAAKPLSTSAWVLVVLSVLQISLGLASFLILLPLDGIPRSVGFYQAVTRTAHQTNGAVLLAASLVLTLRAFRHLGAASVVEPTASSPSSTSSDRTNLEVVS